MNKDDLQTFALIAGKQHVLVPLFNSAAGLQGEPFKPATLLKRDSKFLRPSYIQ